MTQSLEDMERNVLRGGDPNSECITEGAAEGKDHCLMVKERAREHLRRLSPNPHIGQTQADRVLCHAVEEE